MYIWKYNRYNSLTTCLPVLLVNLAFISTKNIANCLNGTVTRNMSFFFAQTSVLKHRFKVHILRITYEVNDSFKNRTHGLRELLLLRELVTLVISKGTLMWFGQMKHKHDIN